MKSNISVFMICTTSTHFNNDYKTLQHFVSNKKKAPDQGLVQQVVLEVPIDFVEHRLGGQFNLKAILDSHSTLIRD